MNKPSDTRTTIADLKALVKHFVEERNWGQYHTPKNLSMNLAVEAAELMEIFLWVDGKESIKELEERRAEVADELADVTMVILNFCYRYNIDLSTVFQEKMKRNAEKYPVEKAKGSRAKYTAL